MNLQSSTFLSTDQRRTKRHDDHACQVHTAVPKQLNNYTSEIHTHKRRWWRLGWSFTSREMMNIPPQAMRSSFLPNGKVMPRTTSEVPQTDKQEGIQCDLQRYKDQENSIANRPRGQVSIRLRLNATHGTSTARTHVSGGAELIDSFPSKSPTNTRTMSVASIPSKGIPVARSTISLNASWRTCASCRCGSKRHRHDLEDHHVLFHHQHRRSDL